MPRHLLPWTVLIALCLGVVGGALLWPTFQTRRALGMIVHDDPAIRESGWQMLRGGTDDAGRLRLSAHLPKILSNLESAPDAAVLDATSRLRVERLWTWTDATRDAKLRELLLLSAHEDPEAALLALHSIFEPDSPLPDDKAMSIVEQLLDHTTTHVRLTALRHAAERLGAGLPSSWLTLRMQDDSPEGRRLGWLLWHALGGPEEALPPTYRDDIEQDASADVLSAAALAITRHRRDDMNFIRGLMQSHPQRQNVPWAYVLHASRDPLADALLQQMAQQGHESASRMLQARDAARETLLAQDVLINRDAEPSLRRLAAWRLREPDHAIITDLLALPPADPDGSVYAASTLAFRELREDEHAEQVERWIRTFDNDEKRAGALLAALSGTAVDLLVTAVTVESDPAVRTAYRNALFALGRPIGLEPPLEFAHRTLRRPDERINPDTVTCLLLSGHRPTLRYLTDLTSEPLSREAVQWRAWLIERFVPHWHEALGRPVGGDGRAIQLHFEALDALRLVTTARLRYDTDSAIFRLADSADE